MRDPSSALEGYADTSLYKVKDDAARLLNLIYLGLRLASLLLGSRAAD
jgi:hypothetical protein